MADIHIVDIAEPQRHDHQQPQPQLHPHPPPRKQKHVKTGTWLAVEDARLREAVAKYGTRWVRVAGEVGTRNGDQCAKRWNENLNPELDHSPWTPEEVSRVQSNPVERKAGGRPPILPSYCPLTSDKHAAAVTCKAVPHAEAFRISGTRTTSLPLSHLTPQYPAHGWLDTHPVREHRLIREGVRLGQDERLLAMVKTYGRNWKFMTDSFLESRAPLALKNRYSLLMRRLDRQGTGHEHAAHAGGAKPPRRTAHSSHPSSVSASPSPNSADDLTNFFGSGGGRGTYGHHPDYPTVDAAGGNFPIPTGPFGAGMMLSGDATATGDGPGRGGGERGTAPWATAATTATTGWDGQNLIWQQHPFLGGGMEPDGVSSRTGANEGENEVEPMTVMSDHGTSDRRWPPSGGGLGPPGVAISNDGESGIALGTEVEYSVTCQRGKLKTLMSHLVDAAMSESVNKMAEDDPVTVTLRLKV